MKPLPVTEHPLIVRTDFSDKSAWERIRGAVQKSYGKRDPSVEFVDDTSYEGMTKEFVLSLGPKNYPHNFIIVADRPALSMPGLPLLIIDLYDNPGREFRAIPSEIYGIEVNLTLANMDFHEFADNVGEDGIFRGFPMPWYIKVLMKVTGGLF